MLFFIVAAPFYIFTGDAQRFQFLYILASSCSFLLFFFFFIVAILISVK